MDKLKKQIPFHWLFTPHRIRRAFFCLACFITFIALFYSVENWRGRRAWEKYKKEWEAKGEHVDLASYLPPPVPNDQNFAKAPLLMSLTDCDPKTGQPRNPNSGIRQWSETQTRGQILLRAGNWRRGQKIDLAESLIDYHKFKKVESLSGSNLDPKMDAREVLEVLKALKEILDGIQIVSRRPYCRFDLTFEHGWSLLMTHHSIILNLGSVFEWRALAELGLGQNDRAFSDIKMLLYLANCTKVEPLSWAQLIRIRTFDCAVQVIWEGLAEHQWSEEQLRELQDQLHQFDFLSDFNLVSKAECARGNNFIEELRRTRPEWMLLMILRMLKNEANPTYPDILHKVDKLVVRCIPSGWFYQNQVLQYQYREIAETFLDAQKQRVHPKRFRQYKEKSPPHHLTPYNFLASLGVGGSLINLASEQTTANEARIACSLERYRLVHGEFPENLEALIPQFIEKLPHDIINGEPLKYRRTKDGQFVLYSVGWNEKDDGGVTRYEANSRVNWGPDWVWQYPEQD